SADGAAAMRCRKRCPAAPRTCNTFALEHAGSYETSVSAGDVMGPDWRIPYACVGWTSCLLAVLVASQAAARQPPSATGSAVLVDFSDDGQFAHLRAGK